tara:strand:- start:44 stop:367 length:324 start_codon:yes stop_codon:yes gene_type:complete
MESVRGFKDISIFGKELPDVKYGTVKWDIDIENRDISVHMHATVTKVTVLFEDGHELHINDDSIIIIEHRGTTEDMFIYGLYVEDIIIDFDDDNVTEVKVIFGRDNS